MADPGLAALDPIFYLHHANVDRMWAAWNADPSHKNPTDPNWLSGPSASGEHEFVMPMPGRATSVFTPKDVNSLSLMNYTYERRRRRRTRQPLSRGPLTRCCTTTANRIGVRDATVVVTALAWAAICISGAPGPHAHALHAVWVGAGAAVNWILMLVAMMSPVLIQPIQFIRGHGLARRRARATLLFLAGYWSIWTIAGVVMYSVAATARSMEFTPCATGRTPGESLGEGLIRGVPLTTDPVYPDYRPYVLSVRREGEETEIMSLRSLVEDGGARLAQLLARLGTATLRFPKVHSSETSTELLETLRFRPAGGHLLYAATARSE